MSDEARTVEVVPAGAGALREVRADDFMPMLSVAQAVDRKRQMNDFINKVLVDGEDYGPMPGGKEDKKVLKKPGAEKLCTVFALAPKCILEKEIEDWTGAEHGGEPLFYYRYKCQLYRGERFMGEAVGSSNSWEAKHRYRWVPEAEAKRNPDWQTFPTRDGSISEPVFAVSKGETGGKYGKAPEYWARFKAEIEAGTAVKIKRPKKDGGEMDCWQIGALLYRIPNPDTADVVNTCQKISYKRALVAAVLVVTNASDSFTQDLDDLSEAEAARLQREADAFTGINTGGHAPGTQAAADYVGSQKLKTNGDAPPALKLYLDSIDKDSTKSTEAFRHLSDALLKKGGARGRRAFDEICVNFEAKYPKGTNDKKALKACVREMWDALQALPEETAPEGEDLFEQQETARDEAAEPMGGWQGARR